MFLHPKNAKWECAYILLCNRCTFNGFELLNAIILFLTVLKKLENIEGKIRIYQENEVTKKMLQVCRM